MENNKNTLLYNVQKIGFALVEANLYLDVYPESEEALQYFYDMKTKYNEAVKEYEAVCGPLTAGANTSSHWDWTLTPWPWEMGVN